MGGPCGRVDVNRDGKVDQLDSTSISQSAWLGTNVSCGGIYATNFACGSERKAPILPAMGISFDTMTYFSDDGLILQGQKLGHTWDEYQDLQNDYPADLLRRRRDVGLIDSVLEQVEHLRSEVEQLGIKLDDESSSLWTHVRKLAPSPDRAHFFLEVFAAVAAVMSCAMVALLLKRRGRV